jgi:hypothetical protein
MRIDRNSPLGSIHPSTDTENCMKTTSEDTYELHMYVKCCILLYMYGISGDVRLNNVIYASKHKK